ncbi:MAG: metal ABC transporter permease [Actinomycetota bacterium]
MSFLDLDFMQRGLLAAGLVGLVAPAIGVFIVQRRLSLLGDGIGHVAVAGVGLGFLTGSSPLVTALAAAVVGAVVIELIRERGKAAGDVALALLFYGGIAGGVFLASLSSNGGSLFSYLFGSVLTVSRSDVAVIGGLSLVVVVVLAVLGKHLFAVAYDEEVARAAGIRTRGLNIALAVIAAVTVVVGMRVVGLLLVAALMVIPVATAQAVSRSFRGTVVTSLLVGILSSLAGVVAAYYLDAFPGATIVLTALAVFVLASALSKVRTRVGA